MQEVTIAMVALGGYGNFYLGHLFNAPPERGIRFVAGIDPNPVGCRHLQLFQERGIPIYPDLERFYAESHADLVVIAAPIHLHLPFTRTALAHGSNVLCEKPVAATIQEARAMAQAEADAEGFVAIGYQWSYAEAIQALKTDIMAGRLGEPRRLRTKVLWPRPISYYHRNSWAAQIKVGDHWVLDSPVNNATAHYLHNCFYVLGATRESSARPVDVQAELYRANEIENYDTAAMRIHTADDVEILYYTAHALAEQVGPVLYYEFADAVVDFGGFNSSLIAHFTNGQTKDYGDPYAHDERKLWDCVDAVRTGRTPACGVEAASSHTLCVNGGQESPSEVVDFPAEFVRREERGDDALVWVEGLQAALEESYTQWVLPSELGGETAPWARAGRVVDLRSYLHFPSEPGKFAR